MNPHNTMNLRKINTEKVRSVLIKNTGLTKNEIASITGLSLATCTNILKELNEHGEIEDIKEANSTGGRKAKRYYFNSTHSRVLCITIRPPIFDRGVNYEVVNLFGETEYKYFAPGNENNFKKIEETIEDILLKFPNIKAIGFSVAGIITKDTLFAGMSCRYEVDDFKQAIIDKFKLPVYMENNANLAVKEYASINKLSKDQSAVLIVDVYGSGVFINGEVCNGYRGLGGEISILPYCLEKSENDIYTTKKGRQFFLNHICLVLTSIINPYVIVLSNSTDGYLNADQECVDEIKEYMKNVIDPQFFPEFVIVDNYEELILNGLKYDTLDLLKYHMSQND